MPQDTHAAIFKKNKNIIKNVFYAVPHKPVPQKSDQIITDLTEPDRHRIILTNHQGQRTQAHDCTTHGHY